MFTLSDDGLWDNPCLPDIVRSTDPGWALLTFDEFYAAHPSLQQYTDLYNQTVVPQSLPPLPAAPAPPRRLRRGTRAEWEGVVVVDHESETCLSDGLDRLEEIVEEDERGRSREHGRCTHLEDPAAVARNLDAVPTDVPADEGLEENIPEAESRQSSSPELPVTTGVPTGV